MSAIEPPTTAKVILHTTKGPIEIELWAKEVPLACRNFLQLCLDGYYDNCIFHRVVKDFVIQSGDPSGTGYGGSCIYDGGSFNDELHSRLRYSRRGLVGCANAGQKNTNGSQFMVTLAPAAELNGKNTLFGRVVGETYFNVMKISEAEVDENERPLYPTKIISSEVLIPYFGDLQNVKPKEKAIEPEKKIIKQKNKVTVKLAYDDDEEEEEGGMPTKAKYSAPRFKMKPAHELLHDKSMDSDINVVARYPENKGSEKFVDMSVNNPPDKNQTDKIQVEIDRMKSSLKRNNKQGGDFEYDISRKKGKSDRRSREQQTLALLENFQHQLSQTSSTTEAGAKPFYEYRSDDEQVPEEEEVDDGGDFMNHVFHYEAPETEDTLITLDDNT